MLCCCYYVAQKIDEKISGTSKSPLDYLTLRNDKTFFFSTVLPVEIEIIINALQPGKAVGPYSITISLLKILSSHITKPLCTIIIESFSSGVFPDGLKLSKVIPQHKKGATDVPSNYRPISLLSIFSKVIEKLMHKRLFEFSNIAMYYIHFNLVSVKIFHFACFNKYDRDNQRNN